jgi:uncharacterized protein YhbP (UPF0306 family)
MNKHKLSITLIMAGLIALGGFGILSATEKNEKQTSVQKKAGGEKKAESIEAGATLSETHPDIEPGMSCNDCHEIKLDAKTSATQVWLYGDYLMWKANEGIMPKDKLKERIVKIIGGKKQKKTFILATSLNNKPLATTLDYSLDPDKMVLYSFSEKGTTKLNHIKNNPFVSLAWHKEFTDFASTLCIQFMGKAELFDGNTKEFEEGLSVYYFEYGAEAQKIPVEQMKQIIKKGMIMTRITIDQITITDNALKNEGFRTRQRWTRK